MGNALSKAKNIFFVNNSQNATDSVEPNISENDNIFVIGCNKSDRLGIGEKKHPYTEKLLPWNRYHPNIDIQTINISRYLTVITTKDDKQICAGSNEYRDEHYNPKHISAAGDAYLKGERYQMRCSQFVFFKKHRISIKNVYNSPVSQHTFFETVNNEFYVTGNNGNNQCGVLNIIPYSHQYGQLYPWHHKPALIKNISKHHKIVDIACGLVHTLILMHNASVEQIDLLTSCWIRDSNLNTSKTIPIVIYEVICDYCGNSVYASQALTGFDGFQKLNSFYRNTNITQIAAGRLHSLFLDDDNTLWSMRHEDYFLGLKTRAHRRIQSRGSNRIFAHHLNDRKLVHLPMNLMGKSIKVKTIKCGDTHCLILDQDGKCYSWGDNSLEQCGFDSSVCKRIINPTRVNLMAEYEITEIKAGSFHNYLRSKNDEHILFGYNRYNVCSLINSSNVGGVYRINDVFSDLTNGSKRICEIFVGNECTWIVSENKH